jgi:hypothetical protein
MTIAAATEVSEGVYAAYVHNEWIAAERARKIHGVTQYRFMKAALATGIRTQVSPAGAVRFCLADVLRMEF